MIEARKSGTLPLLDRPGRADDGSGASRRRRPPGRVVGREGRDLREQAGPAAGAARAIAAPGEAQEDWQIFVTSALALGATLDYPSSATFAPTSRRRWRGIRRTRVSPTLAFARPVSAQHWLQASNPSERWKWDFIPGSAAGQVRRPSRLVVATRGDPDERSQIEPRITRFQRSFRRLLRLHSRMSDPKSSWPGRSDFTKAYCILIFM